MKTYRHVRTEQYTDSEGDLAERQIYHDEDGKEYWCWPGFHMIPRDFQFQADTPMRVVNYTGTYDLATKTMTWD